MNRDRGFTLIELLIVVAIIGVIAAIPIPSLLRARVSANESAAIGDTRTVISAELEVPSTSGGPTGSVDSYCYQARPGVQNRTGVRSFGGDQSGVIVNANDGSACGTPGGVNAAACPPLK